MSLPHKILTFKNEECLSCTHSKERITATIVTKMGGKQKLKFTICLVFLYILVIENDKFEWEIVYSGSEIPKTVKF
jgi:hypothetical protein